MTTRNTEHRIVLHRDGDVPDREDYCVVSIDGEPSIAFYVGGEWIMCSADVACRDPKIEAWFYVEDVISTEAEEMLMGTNDIRDFMDHKAGRI